MRKFFYSSSLLLLALHLSSFTYAPQVAEKQSIIFTPTIVTPIKITSTSNNFFADILNAGVAQVAIDYATVGYNALLQKGLVKKTNILTIVDFSKSSTQKRLHVINIATGKVLLSTWVAHGKNSGLEYATSFSNENESNKSSLGFYTTGTTYNGEHGYSLKLQGCERGINDAAYQRAIVIHGADYVSNDIVQAQGFLGRSLGCPAVPINVNKKLIDLIKGGTCLFVYHPNKKYLQQSKLVG
jgi:hypothetical protein